MKLLFDENLSFRLVEMLASEFPHSAHLESVGLVGASDVAVWEFARVRGYAIVTKDDDFRSLSLVRGAPPKVIWVRVGNGSTATVASLLHSSRTACEAFAASAEESLLILTAS